MKSLLSKINPIDGFAILILMLAPLIFYFPVAVGWKTFGAGDMNNLFLPFRYALAQALAEGRLPLWTPDLQFGFPLFAEGHVAALYPLNLVLFRLFPIHVALSDSSLLHLSWAATGMYVFCRSNALSIASSLLAGFIFAFNGFCLAHIQHLTLLAAASWLPWLLVCQIQYHRAWQNQDRRWIAWLSFAGIVIGLQLVSGFLQVAMMNLAIFFLLGIVQFLLDAPVRGKILKHAVIFLFLAIVSAVLSVGLAAMQWLPSAELLGFSVRSQELGGEFQTSFSLPPEALTQFFAPFAWLGEPTPPNLEYFAYLGIIPLLLMLMAPWLRRQARTWYFFIFGMLSLSFALGNANPLYGILAYIPLYNRFRVPARFMFPFIFAVAFLAAQSFEELRSRLRNISNPDRIAIVFGILFASPIIGTVVGWEKLSLANWMQAWTVLPLLLILLSISIVTLALMRRINAQRFAVLIIGLTLVDYALFSVPLSYTINAQVTPEEFTQAPPIIQTMDPTSSLYRTFTNIYNLTLRPNHLMIYNKQSAQIYSPLALQMGEDYTSINSAATFNLANIRYYFLPSGPLPEEFTEPTASIMLNLFRDPIQFSPQRVARLEVTSYAEQATELPDGFLAGEIILTLSDAQELALPIRIGSETADWAYNGLGAKHSKPSSAIPFPAFLLSIRREFEGLKYVAHLNLLAPLDVVSLHARSFLPEDHLIIERIILSDEKGNSTSLAALAQRNDFAVTFKSHAATTLENRDVMPRAFIVHAAEIATDKQVLARMRDPGFQPEQIVLLNDGVALDARNTVRGNFIDEVVVTEYRPERVKVKVKTDRPGYLLLTDTFYPGWEARIDGQSAQIMRADYMFRAVLIQPGEHTVVFEFHPPLLVVGAITSIFSAILCGVLIVRGFRKSQRNKIAATSAAIR